MGRSLRMTRATKARRRVRQNDGLCRLNMLSPNLRQPAGRGAKRQRQILRLAPSSRQNLLPDHIVTDPPILPRPPRRRSPCLANLLVIPTTARRTVLRLRATAILHVPRLIQLVLWLAVKALDQIQGSRSLPSTPADSLRVAHMASPSLRQWLPPRLMVECSNRELAGSMGSLQQELRIAELRPSGYPARNKCRPRSMTHTRKRHQRVIRDPVPSAASARSFLGELDRSLEVEALRVLPHDRDPVKDTLLRVWRSLSHQTSRERRLTLGALCPTVSDVSKVTRPRKPDHGDFHWFPHSEHSPPPVMSGRKEVQNSRKIKTIILYPWIRTNLALLLDHL